MLFQYVTTVLALMVTFISKADRQPENAAINCFDQTFLQYTYVHTGKLSTFAEKKLKR